MLKEKIKIVRKIGKKIFALIADFFQWWKIEIKVKLSIFKQTPVQQEMTGDNK